MPDANGKVKLLDRARQLLAARHVAARTQSDYVGWIHRFILFHHKRHPSELGKTEAAAFLSDLATTHRLAARERNQALAALVFLYRDVLPGDYPWVSQLRVSVPQRNCGAAPPEGSRASSPPKSTAASNMQSSTPTSAAAKPKLLDQVRDAIRVRHYSPRTEHAYAHWIKRFILFHKKRHPAEMGVEEVTQFLTHLAVEGKVSASTQNQAFSALLFLYERVLEIHLDGIDAVRAKRPKRLPLILTSDEVAAILAHMRGLPLLIAELSYGNGMRLMECLHTRVKDIDLQRLEVTVRDGKGEKDRVTLLPVALRQRLIDHLAQRRKLHDDDLGAALGRAPLPYALAKKYIHADREWGWQYVFPATSHYVDRHTGVKHRHHLHESVIQKSFRRAVVLAGISKPATFHTLRHAFATELLANHYDIRTIQELLGHRHVDTTMIYTHVLNKGGRGVESPLDRLNKK